MRTLSNIIFDLSDNAEKIQCLMDRRIFDGYDEFQNIMFYLAAASYTKRMNGNRE